MTPADRMDKAPRKIVHIDMDAFYASVEQRDNPGLRGLPVVVAKRGPRSVVTAASYAARAYGIHSAMPAMRAERLCPQAVFVAPDFPRYRQVSSQIRAIFRRYTELVEPLSLDEAFLDVTNAPRSLASATATAAAIRAAIRAQTGLTASAGVAPNKFLAKIASEWRKPDGQFVITPARIERFLRPLDIARVPGVGPATKAKLERLGVDTVGALRGLERRELQARFGRWGQRLYELARGIDEREVKPSRPAAQVSAEDTLGEDLVLEALAPHIRRLAEKAWTHHQRKRPRVARTVVLKLKTSDFKVLTRSYTPRQRPTSAAQVADIACALRRRVDADSGVRFRLVGVGLSGFVDGTGQALQGALL